MIGTTSTGEAYSPFSGGTVFEIPYVDGSYASAPITLANSNTYGSESHGNLLVDASGDLFGTALDAPGGYGYGTLFEIPYSGGSYSGTPNVLVNFNPYNGSGDANPSGTIVMDASGDIFGTTSGGGLTDGTVFELVNNGGGSYTLDNLTNFNGSDGSAPEGGLIADAAGNLFGTTDEGGANGYGTVFEMAKTAIGYASTPTTLLSFDGTDGQYPMAGLIIDAAGDLFGTTQGGLFGDGAVFELVNNGDGTYSPKLLASFDGANGSGPEGGLIADAAGNLFGTTISDGPNGGGTVFEITDSGFQVSPPNGPPTLTAPTSLTVAQAKAASLIGISLGETGNTSNESFNVTLMDTSGDLSATGSGVSGSGTTSLTLTGSLPQVNEELGTLSDTDSVTPSDTITLTAGDSLGHQAAPATISVTVNGLPTLAEPSTATIGQGTSTPIMGVTLAETGNTTGETFTVKLTDTNGDLSATGIGISGSGTASLTLTGSLPQVNADLATLSDTDSVTPSDTITLTASDSFGNSSAPNSIAVTVSPAGHTYTLTTGTDIINGAVGNDAFIAGTNTLTSGDQITGGNGTNTLELVGGGIFNLAAPKTLTNIQTITAQEGQGSTAQTVTLRAGLNATVNVVSAAAGDPSPTITITGAANSDVINLGTGNDTVTLGAGETVNSGGGNNTFNTTAAALGSISINGGTIGTNTLTVTNGGTATMGAGLTGIASVRLTAATAFTANALAGLQIIGGSGAETITAGGAGQVLVAGSGTDTLTGSAAGSDTVRGTATGLSGDTVANLLASDIIDITNLAPATAVITSYKVTATATTLTLTDGTNSTTIKLAGADYGSFALAADGSGGTDFRFVPNAALSTFTLPATPVTIAAGPVSSLINATVATLLTGDSITGGTGAGVSNQLLLVGGGAFNLGALAKLTDIQVITAQDGQGATAQTVTLRAGLDATVNVTSDTAGDPAPGITIVGASNADIINLGPGADTVTSGGQETVNGGAGADTYNVTDATIGTVTINGDGGSNTLVVSGGGAAKMGTPIAGINAVKLTTTTSFFANATAGLQISGSTAGGDTITLGAPTQSVVSGGPNETVKASAANASVPVSGLGANSTLEITTGGTITLNAATDVSTVKLDAASMLMLNGMSFITAIGSSGADTIQAGATNQTLTGGGGADTMIGFSGGSDTFRDTATGLQGSTIEGFVTSDTIDISNLAFADAALSTIASGANTKVTVTSGTIKTVFTLDGTWSSSGFHLASDGAAGTFLTHS